MYEEKVKELEAQRTELSNQIYLAKTLEIRERKIALENEVKRDAADLELLRSKSKQIDERVIPELERLKAEIKTLNEESFDARHQVYSVDLGIRNKRSEIWALDRQIRDFK